MGLNDYLAAYGDGRHSSDPAWGVVCESGNNRHYHHKPVGCILLGRFYFVAMRKNYFGICRFAYVMVASSLIQIFRDGLTALVMFTLVNMTPLVAIAVLSHVFWRQRGKGIVVASAAAIGRQGGTAQA
jgi:hypothetical protein